MGYPATALKVMIASPSDVSQERRIVRDVIKEWNVVNAEDRRIVLMPIGWETHSTPEMGQRPQAIINRQVLKDADILVAAFWTRLGSPTGSAASGTVEEIEEHIAGGKPAMIYFSQAPVRPDSVDSVQYSALMSFKESLKLKGLIQEYEDLSDFKTKLSRQLAQTVIRHFAGDKSAWAAIEEWQGASRVSGCGASGAALGELNWSFHSAHCTRFSTLSTEQAEVLRRRPFR